MNGLTFLFFLSGFGLAIGAAPAPSNGGQWAQLIAGAFAAGANAALAHHLKSPKQKVGGRL